MSRKNITALLMVLLLAALLAACGGAVTPTSPPEGVAPVAPTQASGEQAYPVEEPFFPTQDPAAYPAPGESGDPTAVLFAVTLPDGNSVNVTRANLDTLNAVTLEAAGQQVTGPLLSDLLAIAGASGYQRVTIQGPAANLTLEAADINEQLILNLSAPGGPTLVSAGLEPSEWVAGITGIVVE